jgi:UDP-N-acetylmuramyl tripeptide synthase
VRDLPIAYGGAARYNVRNALTALALARALDVPDAAIAEGLTTFRSDPETNPGRANVFEVQGARVWVDFAHNAHGLDALIEAVAAVPAERRLFLFGQAGDRTDADIEALARTAARLQADCYLVAEYPKHLRGRAAGEVPRLLHRTLLDAGIAESAVEDAPDPLAGTRRALAWSKPGDLLVLLILSNRDEALALLRDAAEATAEGA